MDKCQLVIDLDDAATSGSRFTSIISPER